MGGGDENLEIPEATSDPDDVKLDEQSGLVEEEERSPEDEFDDERVLADEGRLLDDASSPGGDDKEADLEAVEVGVVDCEVEVDLDDEDNREDDDEEVGLGDDNDDDGEEVEEEVGLNGEEEVEEVVEEEVEEEVGLDGDKEEVEVGLDDVEIGMEVGTGTDVEVTIDVFVVGGAKIANF